MANAKNHDRGILLFTPIWGLTAFHYASIDIGIIVGVSHFLGGWYLSPDLDLKSSPFLRWGILKTFWLPYQKSIPHRNWKSHAPIVGSMIRLGYLAFWLSPLLLIPGVYESLPAIGWQRAIACFVGVELSAMNHLILDGLVIPLPKALKRRLAGRSARS